MDRELLTNEFWAAHRRFQAVGRRVSQHVAAFGRADRDLSEKLLSAGRRVAWVQRQLEALDAS